MTGYYSKKDCYLRVLLNKKRFFMKYYMDLEIHKPPITAKIPIEILNKV